VNAASATGIVKGSTPLHIAARAGQGKIVHLLLAAGAVVSAADTSGYTPLHAAAREGHTTVVQQLLLAGAHVDAASETGATPLYTAVEYGRYEVVQLLLAAGADARTVGSANHGWSTLHIAGFKGHLGMVQLLLDKGANLRAVDAAGLTVLEHAAMRGWQEMVGLLLGAWGKPDVGVGVLFAAARHAAQIKHVKAFTQLAKELHKLYPALLPRLFGAWLRHDEYAPADAASAPWAVAAVPRERAALAEQRAALRQQEEDVALQKAALQHLIVGVAGMVKLRASEGPTGRSRKSGPKTGRSHGKAALLTVHLLATGLGVLMVVLTHIQRRHHIF
jgi:hypothetical protein